MFCLNKYLLNHHGFFLDGNILNSQIYLWVGQFSLLTVYIGGVINIHILMCGKNQLLPKVKCQKWSIKDWCSIHWMIDQLTRDTLPFLQKYFKIDFFSCFLNFFFKSLWPWKIPVVPKVLHITHWVQLRETRHLEFIFIL